MGFRLYAENHSAEFLIEKEAYEGVKRIAGKVCEDIALVTDDMPKRCSDWHEIHSDVVVAVGTMGNSSLLERLCQENRMDISELQGKRECYMWQLVDHPFSDAPHISSMLVIAGSDKLGTIYGMFRLSEYCGVSPLVYFGDAVPMKQKEIVLELKEKLVSKEPSVKYRGFFINDEWPAFGNWCTERFGGVNAAAYEKMFELLLRLKGNYMWPAMWRSIFSEEGPGLASAELADMYGIVIGLSHHEPMCRAGAEWQNIYQQYGDDNTWSFVTNEEAITKFWEDGLCRNKAFQNVITIGMRGENDSKLLPEDAGLKENIEVVKHAIQVQHDLIRKHISPDLSQVPRMIAIYKEVEDYYYGDEQCEGLKDWEELDDVIFMLCDDNYGNTRGLPTLNQKKHPGGYGMYYHFDYHGAPVSYEWQNSSRLTKTWEQMTQAYEYGIRDLWIVNVGDLKGVEYPLSYFMDLAYDYDTWGSSAVNKIEEYVDRWLSVQFGSRITEKQREGLKDILEGYTRWNARRRPEAMNPSVYHPAHFGEGDCVLGQIQSLMQKADELKNTISKDCLPGYLSMIYYPAAVSLNNIALNVSAAKNRWYAERGSLRANQYGADIERRIALDRQYIGEYHRLFDGKWNHMMDSAHTGFRTWDDKDWTYPVVHTVYPIPEGKIVCGFRNSDEYHLGYHWQDQGPLRNIDFTRPDIEKVVIDLDSRGDMEFQYEVTSTVSWLRCSVAKGIVSPAEQGWADIEIRCDRASLTKESVGTIEIAVVFADGRRTGSRLEIVAAPVPAAAEADLFMETQGFLSIDAEHYQEKRDVGSDGWKMIEYLGGRTGGAIKAFPCTKSWVGDEDAPWTAYDFSVQSGGEYLAEIWLSPRNPVEKGGKMRFGISVNDGEKQIVHSISDDYYTEWFHDEWSSGVTDHVRKCRAAVSVREGRNRLFLYAGDPGVVVEKILLYKDDREIPESYLGPAESYFHSSNQ